MKNKKIKYTNAPPDIAKAIEEGKVIKDFLPKPWELADAEENTKITITLSRKSVDFFKKTAKKKGVAYQAMIRNLLDRYVERWD